MKKIVLAADPDGNPELREIEVANDQDGNPYTALVYRKRKPTPNEIALIHNGYGRMVKW